MNSIELFAGAGGLALGLEKAGFNHLLLNENNHDAHNTLLLNRPYWNINKEDVTVINWHNIKKLLPPVDLLSGGFPCQAFSQSGKRLGFEDKRGNLFYSFAKSIEILQPKAFLGENVKGLLTHNNGDTIKTILEVLDNIGYHVYSPILLNANNYEVAQLRERVFIFGINKKYLSNSPKTLTIPKTFLPLNLSDILLPGKYYPNHIKNDFGNRYSIEKHDLFKLIPEGGNWKSLPLELQKKYLGTMFYSGGGKTGILKRLSMDKPAPTILTTPSQKQTERCHPHQIRPLTIRESARIQSFPDEWTFFGSTSSQYKQIGNAVPVNLAFHMGLHIKNIIKEL